MRILQIHPLLKSEALAPAAGGMARAALQLTRLLAEAGHDVRVMPIPEGVGSRELWEVSPGHSVEVPAVMHIPGWRDAFGLPGAALRLKPGPAGVKNLLYDLFALTALRREVNQFHPDIIHNHLARRPFPRLARALRLRGNLLLTHHHGEMGEELQVYDRIVFPSRFSREQIVAQSRFPIDRTKYIYYPVAPAFCRLPLAEDQPREGILFVGAVRRRKGIDLLLDAYRLDPSLRREPLSICGIGEDSGLVDQAIHEGLPIQTLGQLSPEDLAKRLMGVKLVVIPSRLEALSVAILEALCCGVPVIGWEMQLREIEDALGRSAGAPFDGRRQTAMDLAAAMKNLLGEKMTTGPERIRLAEAARELFSEQRYLKDYMEVYRDIKKG
jgi:glycosyltransferase involved in cell wall biosynthesis